MNVTEWLAWANERLQKAGIETPRLEAQVLLAHALGADRSWLLANPKSGAPPAANALLDRRINREPLAYIIGYREFFGRRFSVSPDVLIPRQETETLIEYGLEVLRGVSNPRVLDICTGSGCIGITLKCERPDADVTLSDISPAALEIAQANALALKAEVRAVESDLFEHVSGSYDLIIANPPYVAITDQLEPEVRDHEPEIALFADENGFAIYRRIAKEAKTFVATGGTLIVEAGDRQAGKIQEIFEQNGWINPDIRSDLGGELRSVAHKLP